MAKQRKSLLRQEYEKEYKRIDRNLLKLRKEGYDISALQLPPKNPQRVTQGRLNTLKAITPQWLRSALKEHRTSVIPEKGTPLRNKKGEFLSKEEIITEAKRISERNARRQERLKEVEKRVLHYIKQLSKSDDTEELPFTPETIEEYTPPEDSYSTYDETEEYEEPTPDYYDYTQEPEEPTPEEEEPPSEERETYSVIEENEVLYVDLETGEIIDRSPLGVDITDETVIYYDAETGEIIKTEPNTYGYESYDASSYVLEYLDSLFEKFSYGTQDRLHNIMDTMIDRVGLDNFITAMQEKENGWTLLELIEASGFDYEEICRTFGLAIERMDIPEEDKDYLREEIYERSGFFEGA